MNTYRNMQELKPRLGVIGCATLAIVLSVIEIASHPISPPQIFLLSSSELIEAAAAALPATPARGNAHRCAECGVIESTQGAVMLNEASASAAPAGTNSTENAPELSHLPGIQIRMQDGSIFLINEPHPGKWRLGERVKVMAGVN